jgi:hypothetical protein
VLAADTRIGTTKERHDDSAKIHVIKPHVLIEGHKVLAVGTSGNAYLSRKALQIIIDNPTAGERMVDIVKQAWELEIGCETVSFSLLIVCVDVCYIFNCKRANQKATFVFKKHDRAVMLSNGSGSYVALLLMKYFGVSSKLAVASASTVDKATGHFVQYRRITDKCGALQQHLYKSKAITIDLLKTHIVKKPRETT